MVSALDVKRPETYFGLEVGFFFFFVEIFRAGKFVEKGGKSREMGGEHVTLPAPTQGRVPKQKVREESSSHTTRGRDRPLMDLTLTFLLIYWAFYSRILHFFSPFP